MKNPKHVKIHYLPIILSLLLIPSEQNIHAFTTSSFNNKPRLAFSGSCHFFLKKTTCSPEFFNEDISRSLFHRRKLRKLNVQHGSIASLDWLLPSAFEMILIKRILFAGLVGCFIGLERRKSNRPAGFRTMTLTAVGACIFTITSIYGFQNCQKADQARVAAGVASGVGFIGAGVITRAQRPGLKQRSSEKGQQLDTQEVRGLTTAAAIWISAALGMACGSGLEKIAFYGAGITILIMRAGQILKTVNHFFVQLLQNICSTRFASKPLPKEAEPARSALLDQMNFYPTIGNLSDVEIAQAAYAKIGKISHEMNNYKGTEQGFKQLINPFFDDKNMTATFISLASED